MQVIYIYLTILNVGLKYLQILVSEPSRRLQPVPHNVKGEKCQDSYIIIKDTNVPIYFLKIPYCFELIRTNCFCFCNDKIPTKKKKYKKSQAYFACLLRVQLDMMKSQIQECEVAVHIKAIDGNQKDTQLTFCFYSVWYFNPWNFSPYSV